MNNEQPYPPPKPTDFTVTAAIRIAALDQTPTAVYDRYRHLVEEQVFTAGQIELKVFLREMAKDNRFMSAYFQPNLWSPEELMDPESPTDDEIARMQLDERPFQRACAIAHEAVDCLDLPLPEKALASVIAFVYPSGLLYDVGVLQRAGTDLRTFTQTTYCRERARFLRPHFVQQALKVVNKVSAPAAFYLGAALNDRNTTHITVDKVIERLARVTSAVAWSYPRLLLDIEKGLLAPTGAEATAKSAREAAMRNRGQAVKPRR